MAIFMTGVTGYIGSYVANGILTEHGDRLAVLEGNYDPGTLRLLEDVGVEVGWRCAEVGAGRGSVAAWLADAEKMLGRDVDFTNMYAYFDTFWENGKTMG